MTIDYTLNKKETSELICTLNADGNVTSVQTSLGPRPPYLSFPVSISMRVLNLHFLFYGIRTHFIRTLRLDLPKRQEHG